MPHPGDRSHPHGSPSVVTNPSASPLLDGLSYRRMVERAAAMAATPPVVAPCIAPETDPSIPTTDAKPGAAPQGATLRNTAPQGAARDASPGERTKPAPVARRRPLNPNQLTAARMLLTGHYAVDVAATIGVHPYTVSRWKSDPRFQAELRRQVAHAAARDEVAAQALQGAAPRNTAPQGATPA